MKTAGALGLAAPLGVLSTHSLWAQAAAPAGELKKVKFATNATAICLAPVCVAIEHGILKKYGLEVHRPAAIRRPGLCRRADGAASALARDESRGMHQREDRPETNPAFGHRILVGGLDRVWTRADAGVAMELAS